ncbi:MAG: hypothetical protein E3J42_06945, partial [Dehalococcoidia bacterium]
MHTIKFQWKRGLLMFTALVLTATLVLGCAAEKTIKFSNTEYESVWLANAVAGFIIEEGYGYPVEPVSVSVAVAEVSLSKGDLHAWL